MEPAEIRALLEKYWQAETTVAEEQHLAAYFRQPEIAPDLELVRELFAWRDEESQVTPGAGFDQRILDRIAGMGAGAAQSGGAESGAHPAARPGGTVTHLTRPVGAVIPFRMAAAAAVILSLGIGLLIALTAPRNAAPSGAVAATGVEKTTSVTNATLARTTAPAIKDTYTDPRLALSAVRNALLLASVRINEGEHITQRNINRLHTNWEIATGE